MKIQYWVAILLISLLFNNCQDEPNHKGNKKCISKNTIEACNISTGYQIVMDTSSTVEFRGDSLLVTGKAYLKILNHAKFLKIKWNNYFILLRSGTYEISKDKTPYINVFSGSGKLETNKLNIDIDSGTQLQYISGNNVLIPLSQKYPDWVPDSLFYK